MKQLAVIGQKEFTLGFRLAGIRKVLEPEQEHASLKMHSLLHDSEVGIILIDGQTMELLDAQTREDAVASLSPVVVQVSEQAGQEELRKMILQSIGVDLLKE